MDREVELEDVLRLHPGVLDAAVVRNGNAVIAFVLPDEGYLDLTLCRGSTEHKALAKWQKVFDLTQLEKSAASAPVGFNTLGWNSSYTRQPIPAEQMHEWVESTVADILTLAPKTVCELGCGTGMLLMKIAGRCDHYTAVDFSSIVLDRLREQLRQVPELAARVDVVEGRAHSFHGLDQNPVDTVVINSVVQYFPSVSYLTKVLQNAVEMVREGGRIFVGDVLSLPLLPLFASSVVMFQAEDDTRVSELRRRVQRRIDTVAELILSPAYFLSLPGRFSKISRVEIWPRRDRADTEMSRYRYQAVLHIGNESRAASETEFLDWGKHECSLEDLRSTLQHSRGEYVGIKQIRNARLELDLAFLTGLESAEATLTAGQLRREADLNIGPGLHPEDLVDLGRSLDSRVSLSWAACRSDGSYDAFFAPAGRADRTSQAAIRWPEPDASAFVRYANAPGQNGIRREFVDQMRTHCRQKLPTGISPDEIWVVNTLARSPDGEIDTTALMAAKALECPVS